MDKMADQACLGVMESKVIPLQQEKSEVVQGNQVV
jgi:hypothetical protein